MLDNLTEDFYTGRKEIKKRKIVDFHIPHADKDGQWWYGYQKVTMIRHDVCTFPTYNGKMDTSNTENDYE